MGRYCIYDISPYSLYGALLRSGECVCKQGQGCPSATRHLTPHFCSDKGPPASQRHQAPSNAAHPGSPFTFQLPRLPANRTGPAKLLVWTQQQQLDPLSPKSLISVDRLLINMAADIASIAQLLDATLDHTQHRKGSSPSTSRTVAVVLFIVLEPVRVRVRVRRRPPARTITHQELTSLCHQPRRFSNRKRASRSTPSSSSRSSQATTLPSPPA